MFIFLFLGFSFEGLSQSDRFAVDEEIKAYMQLKSRSTVHSVAHGTVGNGSLEQGKLFPYKGTNFMYFDRESYLEGRAFLHSTVHQIILNAYDSLWRVLPNRFFGIMECANEHGGSLFPHRTHQNGLSVDFMMPLVKNGKPYYGLDTLGAKHYTLNFDDAGRYSRDSSIAIDLNLAARHILILDDFARQQGMKIEKVILKIELKDVFYATPYGKIVKERGIYLARSLSPLVNSLHDDHFHIDFGFQD